MSRTLSLFCAATSLVSIAAAQGIQREDVITEVDGRAVTNVASFRDALTKADPTRGVLLYLDRKGGRTFAVLKAQ